MASMAMLNNQRVYGIGVLIHGHVANVGGTGREIYHIGL